jgi:hypothetical protein
MYAIMFDLNSGPRTNYHYLRILFCILCKVMIIIVIRLTIVVIIALFAIVVVAIICDPFLIAVLNYDFVEYYFVL